MRGGRDQRDEGERGVTTLNLSMRASCVSAYRFLGRGVSQAEFRYMRLERMAAVVVSGGERHH